MLDDVQAAPIAKLDVDEKWITVPAAVKDARVRIVRLGDTSSSPRRKCDQLDSKSASSHCGAARDTFAYNACALASSPRA